MSDLRRIAERVREQRLAGDQHNGTDVFSPLSGYCFDNAYVLYHALCEAGYDPVVVEGVADQYAEEILAYHDADSGADLDSLAQVDGFVHYWVEVPKGGTVIDLATESRTSRVEPGELLISETLPDDLHRFPESYAEGQTSLQWNDQQGGRCQFCGDSFGPNACLGCGRSENTPALDG